VPADKKGPIEEALNNLKEAHKSQDFSKIDSATTELNTAWTAASEEIYKATQSQPGADAQDAQPQGSNNENVTDAEFEEVK